MMHLLAMRPTGISLQVNGSLGPRYQVLGARRATGQPWDYPNPGISLLASRVSLTYYDIVTDFEQIHSICRDLSFMIGLKSQLETVCFKFLTLMNLVHKPLID
jgi:hypothetical protein